MNKPRLSFSLLLTALLSACDVTSSNSNAGNAGAPPIPTTTTPPASESTPPPPSGGTLAVSGGYIAVADSGRDRVLIVNGSTRSVQTVVTLRAGDEPGRVIPGLNAGEFFVALRWGNAVAKVNYKGSLWRSPKICSMPRGLALTGTTLRVACAGGEVASLRATDLAVLSQGELNQDKDYRDLVTLSGRGFVTTYKGAALQEFSPTSFTTKYLGAASSPSAFIGTGARAASYRFAPTAAAKTIAVGPSDLLMLHQESFMGPLSPETNGFACVNCGGSVVRTAVTTFTLQAPSTTPYAELRQTGQFEIPNAVVPIDITVSPDQAQIAVVAAGNTTHPVIVTSRKGAEARRITAGASRGVIAAHFTANDQMVIQTRQPASLLFVSNTGTILADVALGGLSQVSTGAALFMQQQGAVAIACASCHLEGGDDGRTWNFSTPIGQPRYAPPGLRKTQNLRTSSAMTAPFHWQGNLWSFDSLAVEGYQRMSTSSIPSVAQVVLLENWVRGLRRYPTNPAAAGTARAAAVSRGAELFASLSCNSCHGSKAAADIVSGGSTMNLAPSLDGVRFRAPYMHHGCARTLSDRFTSPECGGKEHTALFNERIDGTSLPQIDASQTADLVEYLRSL